MAEQNVGFRSALFGGFQREDVLQYIEKMDSSYAEQTAQLKGQAEDARNALSELRAQNREYADKNKELLQKIETMAKDMDSFRAQMDEIERNFAQQEAEHNAQEESMLSLLADNEALQQENERLQKKCGEYDAAKEKIAEMELSAYRRAKKIEQDAREEAKKVQAQSKELLARVRQQLDETSEGYKAVLAKSQAESEAMTRRAKKTLAELDQITGKLGSERDSAAPRGLFQKAKEDR